MKNLNCSALYRVLVGTKCYPLGSLANKIAGELDAGGDVLGDRVQAFLNVVDDDLDTFSEISHVLCSVISEFARPFGDIADQRAGEARKLEEWVKLV